MVHLICSLLADCTARTSSLPLGLAPIASLSLGRNYLFSVIGTVQEPDHIACQAIEKDHRLITYLTCEEFTTVVAARDRRDPSTALHKIYIVF